MSVQSDQATGMDDRELAENMQKLLVLMSRLDQKIAPMLDADGEYFNQRYVQPLYCRILNWMSSKWIFFLQVLDSKT